jgi:MFS transporter, AAHS family, 3-hydroxyphenylpropionic acid transporter
VHLSANNDIESNTPFRLIGMWFLAAIIEGVDLQSAGIAGPGIKVEFGFGPAQMGWIFSAGMFGLVLGAVIGGRLADIYGRKPVLIASIAAYGLFSVATAHGWNLQSLLLFRILTGLGLGGAVPNLIALAAESTTRRRRNSIIGLMYCGMPLGSAMVAAIGWFGLGSFGWRVVFYAGGIVPLLVAPLLAFWLPESPLFIKRGAKAVTQSIPVKSPTVQVLFGESRWGITLALWLSSFCTYFVLYLLLNWLPSLLSSKGYSGRGASAVMIVVNLGSVLGILAGGVLMDRLRHTHVILGIYGGLLAAIIGLSQAQNLAVILLSAMASTFCLAASQMIQYSLAPACYPAEARGTGVGAMVGVGRTGSIAGPLSAGQLLAAGAATSVVVSAGVPGLIASAVALLLAHAGRSGIAVTPASD